MSCIEAIVKTAAYGVGDHPEFFLFKSFDQVKLRVFGVKLVTYGECGVLHIHIFVPLWKVYLHHISPIPPDGFIGGESIEHLIALCVPEVSG
jgi:hypothetical protein